MEYCPLIPPAALFGGHALAVQPRRDRVAGVPGDAAPQDLRPVFPAQAGGHRVLVVLGPLDDVSPRHPVPDAEIGIYPVICPLGLALDGLGLLGVHKAGHVRQGPAAYIHLPERRLFDGLDLTAGVDKLGQRVQQFRARLAFPALKTVAVRDNQYVSAAFAHILDGPVQVLLMLALVRALRMDDVPARDPVFVADAMADDPLGLVPLVLLVSAYPYPAADWRPAVWHCGVSAGLDELGGQLFLGCPGGSHLAHLPDQLN